MAKTVETFEATLVKEVKVEPIVDMLGDTKFIKHHKGFQKGDSVTIQKLTDQYGNVEFVIPSGTFRCEGIAGVDPNQWQTSSRGAVSVAADSFLETPKKRSIAALLKTWALGSTN